MASKAHIAALREQSLTTLQETSQAIAAALGIEPPALDSPFRDPDLLQATQLHELAQFNQRLADVVAGLAADATEQSQRVAELTAHNKTLQSEVEALTEPAAAQDAEPKPKAQQKKGAK